MCVLLSSGIPAPRPGGPRWSLSLLPLWFSDWVLQGGRGYMFHRGDPGPLPPPIHPSVWVSWLIVCLQCLRPYPGPEHHTGPQVAYSSVRVVVRGYQACLSFCWHYPCCLACLTEKSSLLVVIARKLRDGLSSGTAGSRALSREKYAINKVLFCPVLLFWWVD